MTTRKYSIDDGQTELLPKQEVLPSLAMPERMYLEGLTAEPTGRGIFNLIAGVQRDFRARRATTTFLDEVREQFFTYTQARVEAELQGELAKMVEDLRHALTMLQLEHYATEQEFATQRTMQLRISAARHFKKFGSQLVEMGYPEEQIARALTNTVSNMLSVAGAEIATMEGIDAFATEARPQSYGRERLGGRDAGAHAEPR
jgi:hypothetical protein